MASVLAWHFTADTLRDGRPVPAVGEILTHDGEVIPCVSGLHASTRVLDALGYAPGGALHRVEVWGDIQEHGDPAPADKIVARHRKIVWSIPAERMNPLLREFARSCALQVIHLWDAPDVVQQYLETGDESLQDAAQDAARAAAWDAARAAARDAAWAAAWAAARYAARDVARYAARAAARHAARYAARYAARAVAQDAAWDVAWDAAQGAAWDAAWDAAWAAQNERLTALVMAAHEEGES